MKITNCSVRPIVLAILLSPVCLPAVPPQAAGSEGTKGSDRLFSLAGQAGLPSYLKGNKDALADADGIRGGEVRSIDTDYINKDFVFDVVFQFKEDERSIALLGIGENARDGGWIVNSVLSRIHGPGLGGYATVTFHRTFEEGKVGEFKTPGPHLFRLAKKGAALTMAICANYQGGEIKPDFSKTIPDLKRTAPYLNRLNSALFFGGDATFKAVRLEVNGKLVDPGPPATQGFKGISGPEHLIKLAGGQRLPSFLSPPGGLTIDKDGLHLSGTSIHTRATDFLNKNFTFDVIYHFLSDEDRSIMLVGIGENARDGGWFVNTVCARVHGPGHGGTVSIAYDHNPYEPQIGHLGHDHIGPNLFRLQRCGDTLLMAVCADYKGKFEPDLVKTIPALRHVAPYLTLKNSSLFISDGGVIEQVRLVVEGEDVESYDVVLNVPAQIVQGQPVHQKIEQDPSGKRFSAESAPDGLTLTPAGELAWAPTREQVGHHEFKVRITENGQTTFQIVEIDVIAAKSSKTAEDKLPALNGSSGLRLAGGKHRIVPGFGGTSLLLLEGDSLRRLDADGFTVGQALKLPGAYEQIGERKDYFVALTDERKSLDLIDKKTLRVRHSIPMDYSRRIDLALHPLKAVTYATVEKTTKEGPRTFILIVDEFSGDVREPEGFLGTWVKVSPDGKALYAADSASHETGVRLLISADGLRITTENVGIDRLIVYDMSGPTPREVAVKKEAGVNGSGLALSPDGRRLSYLSHAGYPLFSYNVPAWDPNDLTRRPISYPTRVHHANPERLTFHPVLPIAAAPAEGGAVCFDRETGEIQSNRLDLRMLPNDEKVLDVIFSPDGRNLILDLAANGEHFLRKVKLTLSAQENAHLQDLPHRATVP